MKRIDKRVVEYYEDSLKVKWEYDVEHWNLLGRNVIFHTCPNGTFSTGHVHLYCHLCGARPEIDFIEALRNDLQ